MDRKEYCTRKFGSWARCEEMHDQISEVGKSVGLKFQFELQSNVPNTLDTHRVIWLAGQTGVQDEVVEALFQGYFCEGVDFTNRSAMIEVAVSAGLDRRRLDELFSSNEGLAEVQGEEQAVKLLGVSSVPLFIIEDRVAVSGAQPPEAILKAYEQAQQTPRKHKRSEAPVHRT